MYKWSDFDIKFDEHDKNNYQALNMQCPKCDKKRKKHDVPTLFVYPSEQSWFCQHCGFSGDLISGLFNKVQKKDNFVPLKYNKDILQYPNNPEINKNLIDTFKKKKISEATLKHFKISQHSSYFPELEDNLNSIIYPYFQEGRIVNLVYFYGKYKHSEFGGVESCFNYDSIDNDQTYIVLDELEVFTFFECDKPNVISLFGGYSFNKLTIEQFKNKALEFLTVIEDKLMKVKKFTLALPNTEYGDALRDELLRRLGKERCWIVQPPEQGYTWNKILIDYGKQKFNSLLETARACPVRGIFSVEDVEEQLDELYIKGLRKGYTTGIDTLDEYYTVVPGQWTIVTGIPGHGKSNFLDQLTVNLAKNHDWRFGIFSPENQPIARHYANIMEKYCGQPFDIGKTNRITDEQKEDAKKWLNKHFHIILPDEDDNWSIDGILELAKVLVYRNGMKGMIIDPWNEIDHSRPASQTETEYVSSVLTKIRKFARNYDVHVWLVAHPAKLYKQSDGKYPVPTPYDISGSAHYRNKADNAITVWRNVGHEDQSVADVHIQKIRFKEVGKVGLVSLRFDPFSGNFVDDIDQNKRRQALEEGAVIPTEKLRRKY